MGPNRSIPKIAAETNDAEVGERLPSGAARLPGLRRGNSSLRTAVLFFCAALCLASFAARAQSGDADAQQWTDGTWVGDEGNWDEAPPPPEDGQVPSDDGNAMGNYDSTGTPQDDGSQGVVQGGGYQAGYAGNSSSQRDDYSQGYQDGYQDSQAAGPSIDDFHSSLDSQGQWIDTPEYGHVWRPTQVDSQWRPYSDGQWTYTEAGWYWNGAEPWGWAVYHYGRWAYYNHGWYWVPGRIWGPSWVSWRWGGRYAGWAPLGPRGAVWGSPNCWVVVEQNHFLEPARHNAQTIRIAQAFIQQTRVLPIVRPGPRAGPIVHNVSLATGQFVVPARLQPVRSAGQATYGGRGMVVNVYRPQTRPIVGVTAPVQAPRHRPAPDQRHGVAGPVSPPSAPFEHRPPQQQQPAESGEVYEQHTPSRGKVIEFETPRQEPQREGSSREGNGQPIERQGFGQQRERPGFGQPVQREAPEAHETRQDRFERETRESHAREAEQEHRGEPGVEHRSEQGFGRPAGGERQGGAARGGEGQANRGGEKKEEKPAPVKKPAVRAKDK